MFKFKCKPDGGKAFEVNAESRAIAAWETAPGQPKGTRRRIGDIHERLDMAAMVDLAWFAASRAELTQLDIKEWRDQVDITLEAPDEDDDAEAGPTQPIP
jgi:hypothetical protein